MTTPTTTPVSGEALEPVDRYGNRDGELKYCSFPDCGCDGARLCMAEEGASWASIQLNLEKRASPIPTTEPDHGIR